MSLQSRTIKGEGSMRRIALIAVLAALVVPAQALAGEQTITQETGSKPNYPHYAAGADEAGRWLLNEEMGEGGAYPFTTFASAPVKLSASEIAYRLKAVTVGFALHMFSGTKYAYRPVVLHVNLRLGKSPTGYYGQYLQCSEAFGCSKQLLAEGRVAEQPPHENGVVRGSFATYSLRVISPSAILKARTVSLETYVEGAQAAGGGSCPGQGEKFRCTQYFEVKPTVTVTLETL